MPRPSVLVPPLPLGQLASPAKALDLAPELAAGSDRSCGTIGLPVGSCPPTIGVLAADFDQYDPDTPRSAGAPCGFSMTPRAGFAALSLASPPHRFMSYCSPREKDGLSTPRFSPQSSTPRSASMASPLRLVGSRSPCSVRLTSSGQLTPQGIVPVDPGAVHKANQDCDVDGKTKAQRVLQFPDHPTAIVLDCNAAWLAKYRELSFSDLLDAPGGARSSIRQSPVPLTSLGVVRGKNADPNPQRAIHPNIDNQTTPRKRPRKNKAPKRSDFESDVAMVEGATFGLLPENGYGARSAAQGSSYGETSDHYGATAGPMDEDQLVQTSPAKATRHRSTWKSSI